jgi:hypothetical protein
MNILIKTCKYMLIKIYFLHCFILMFIYFANIKYKLVITSYKT